MFDQESHQLKSGSFLQSLVGQVLFAFASLFSFYAFCQNCQLSSCTFQDIVSPLQLKSLLINGSIPASLWFSLWCMPRFVCKSLNAYYKLCLLFRSSLVVVSASVILSVMPRFALFITVHLPGFQLLASCFLLLQAKVSFFIFWKLIA